MPQPKSGSIGRSPGAVAKINRIDSSTRCSARAWAILPFGVTCSGNFQPMPRKRRSGDCVSSLSSGEQSLVPLRQARRTRGICKSRIRHAGRTPASDGVWRSALRYWQALPGVRNGRSPDLEGRLRADFDVAGGLHRIALEEQAHFVRGIRLCVGRVELHGVAGIRGRRGEGEGEARHAEAAVTPRAAFALARARTK